MSVKPTDKPSWTTEDCEVISAYIKQNPSLQLALDSSTGPYGYDTQHQDLRERRANAVREVLIQAGVPSDKIKVGAVGDPQSRRDDQVQVLISTGN